MMKEVLNMATSSIFAQVNIDTPSKLESFLKALEEAENIKKNSPQPRPSGIRLVTDPDEIRKMMARRGSKH